MRNVVKPLEKLRRNIRRSVKTSNDTTPDTSGLLESDSFFNRTYDAGVVEQALHEFEAEISQDDILGDTHKVYRRLLKDAQRIAATSDDMDIRDFAREVAAFLVVTQGKPTPGNPLRIVAALDEIDPL